MEKNQGLTPLRDVNQELSEHSGTQYYIQHALTKFKMSQGVDALRNEYECFWLIDDLLLETKANVLLSVADFITWTLKRHLTMNGEWVETRTNKFKLIADDGNGIVLFESEIPWSNFKGDIVKLYLSNDVLFLPSEY